MPFYEVRKGQDAYKGYSTVVEAEDPNDAFNAAYHAGDWIPNGEDPEFGDATFFEPSEDGVVLLSATTFEEAVKQIHEAYDFIDLQLKPSQRDIILAALRLWIDLVNDGAEYINDKLLEIATNGYAHALMDDKEIDALCQEINS